MTGVMHGGWGYVYAAYLVAWIGLITYGTLLFIRSRRYDDGPDRGDRE